MGRLIRISIYALIILILYFWLTAVLKSYDKKDTSITKYESVLDTISSDTMEYPIDDGNTLSNEDIVDGEMDYKALDEKVKKLEENKPVASGKKTESITPNENLGTKTSVKSKSQKPDLVSDNNSTTQVKGDGGPYLVMAGSYLLKDNAAKMVNKLKKMGYSQAETVVFQASEYHSVVAARYNTESKAKSAAADLKRKGVDSFVKSI